MAEQRTLMKDGVLPYTSTQRRMRAACCTTSCQSPSSPLMLASMLSKHLGTWYATYGDLTPGVTVVFVTLAFPDSRCALCGPASGRAACGRRDARQQRRHVRVGALHRRPLEVRLRPAARHEVLHASPEVLRLRVLRRLTQGLDLVPATGHASFSICQNITMPHNGILRLVPASRTASEGTTAEACRMLAASTPTSIMSITGAEASSSEVLCLLWEARIVTQHAPASGSCFEPAFAAADRGTS